MGRRRKRGAWQVAGPRGSTGRDICKGWYVSLEEARVTETLDTVRQLLPTDAYTTDAWFAREQRELFGRVWNFAGMREDLSKPGDYLCVQAGVFPLVLIQGDDGELRAFHNLCRHRGSRLLEGAGNGGPAVRCFYHGWTYALDGSLQGVPQEESQFPGLDKSACGLHPASVGAWRNLLFVHPEQDAEPLTDWLADFPQHFGPHDPEALLEVSNVRYRFRANWKIVVENFIDGYHFFHLHSVSLGNGDFARQAWLAAGRHWTFKRPLKEGMFVEGKLLPIISDCGPQFGIDAHVLFPNLGLYGTATSWLTFHIVPVAPDLSYVDIRTRAMPEALARLRPERERPVITDEVIVSASGPIASYMSPSPKVHPLESNDVMAEDIYACEAIQKGMQSPRYQVGAMSTDYERALMWYQQNVLDFVPLNSA